MNRKSHVTSEQQAIAFLRDVSIYPVNITLSDEQKRPLNANAQYYAWLPVIAKHYGESVEYVRKWMKKEIAWPVLERSGCDYSRKMRYMLDKAGYHNLNAKQQIEMIDMFGVTRFMTSKQHKEMRDELQIYWAKNGLELNYYE